MIEYEGQQFENHTELFKKYPWLRKVNKRKNLPVLTAEYAKPCLDCKLRWHPAAMTLDHTERDGYHNSRGERIAVSSMLSYPPELFLKEIAKCEPVCSNCHKIRELRRDRLDNRPRWKGHDLFRYTGALLTNQQEVIHAE